MRILMVAPPWTPIPPTKYGGIEFVVSELIKGLTALGHEVVLVASGDSKVDVELRSVIKDAEGMRIGMAVPELRHVLFARLQMNGFDIVHDHTVAGPVMAAFCNNSCPVVTTIHGPFNEELNDIYSQTSSKVPLIAISNSQANSALNVEIGDIIHHGIDVTTFPFGAGDGNYLFCLGRMSESKGIHRAIKVANMLNMELRIAAKMRETHEIEYFNRYIEPELSETIIYEGEVSHARKLELLRDARALLFPIRWNEPFGMVMLEAMASGTPVIAFKEGAAVEVVNDGVSGFLVDDEVDMASAVEKSSKLDRALVRSYVESEFSVEKMAQRHIDFYKRTIANFNNN